ncbi:unnamed protein product, partial [Urochloa humidicola]
SLALLLPTAASARWQPPAVELAYAGGGGARPVARGSGGGGLLPRRQRAAAGLSLAVGTGLVDGDRGEPGRGERGRQPERVGKKLGKAAWEEREMPCVADELRKDPDGELGVHHATRLGSTFLSLSSGGGSSSSSTSDLVLELSVLVHGGGGRIRSSSVLSVEGPAGVKQGRRGGSLKASGSGSSSDWWWPAGGGPLSFLRQQA